MPAPEMFGKGRNLRIFVTAAGTEGNTFTRPPVENTLRCVPSGLPEVGSNTIPTRAGTIAPSVVVTVKGTVQPVVEVPPPAQTKSPRRPDRSPPRSATVGVVA